VFFILKSDDIVIWEAKKERKNRMQASEPVISFLFVFLSSFFFYYFYCMHLGWIKECDTWLIRCIASDIIYIYK